MMSWPDDADGDVFRNLAAGGFDFASVHSIDFHVDFPETAAAPQEALRVLEATYGALDIGAFDGGASVRFVLTAHLTYDLVKEVLAGATSLAAPFGGECEAWGVAWTPPKAA